MIYTAHVAFSALFGAGNAYAGRRFPPPPGRDATGDAPVLRARFPRISFASWRFRAEIGPGHQVATGGPFRFVRHPIYAGMDLLALGTAVWIPSWIVWLGFALMVLGSDLRARAEEPLLEEAFGDAYRDYRGGTYRFLPGIY